MSFQHCAIVGLGLLGGSLAVDLRRHYPGLAITGIARRQATLDEAAQVTVEGVPAFDRLSLDIAAAGEAELVVLCTPVQTILTHLATLGPLLSAGTVVTDVGSTKRAVMNAATLLPPGVLFVGGHPMAGSDRMGLQNARANLYRKATWALCVPAGAEEAAERLSALISTIGARPLLIDPIVHDQLVALTSHLPHVSAGALAKVVLDSPHGDAVLDFIAGGFRDATRIAAADPAMWRDIFLTNRDNLLAALDTLLAELGAWREAIRTGDEPHIEALLTDSRNRRERLN